MMSEQAAISQRQFDDRYIAFLAKNANVPKGNYRPLLLYLAQKCDRRRYENTQPNNLGRVGRPPAKEPIRSVFGRSKMAKWEPMASAISQKQYDDNYITLLAKEAKVRPTHYRKLLLHLAATRDTRRYHNTQPGNLGRRGRPLAGSATRSSGPYPRSVPEARGRRAPPPLPQRVKEPAAVLRKRAPQRAEEIASLEIRIEFKNSRDFIRVAPRTCVFTVPVALPLAGKAIPCPPTSNSLSI